MAEKNTSLAPIERGMREISPLGRETHPSFPSREGIKGWVGDVG